MNLFGINVALMRKRIGLTQKELAERVGVGETTIQNIETGYLSSPTESLIDKLCSAFDTTRGGLLGLTPLDVGERSRAIYVTDSISNDKPFLEIDRIVDTIFIDRDELRGYEYIGLRIGDNAMEKSRICLGDTVLVRKDAIVKNGDIVVAVYKDSDSVVRRYYKNANQVILKSDDEKYYPDIALDTEKDRFVVIGKVVKCLFNL
ncbi:MAG: helix-turn-helix domain-containing protein [Clostridia bacterium]|nr:helix-turn-helix domain-containing protein [Clostridia bacterium]